MTFAWKDLIKHNYKIKNQRNTAFKEEKLLTNDNKDINITGHLMQFFYFNMDIKSSFEKISIKPLPPDQRRT